MIAAAIAAAFLSVAGWYYLSLRDRPAPQNSIADACMTKVIGEYRGLIETNLSAKETRLRALTTGITKDTTAADYDHLVSANNAQDKTDDIAVYSAFCTAYATCVHAKPFKTTFDACYEAWAEPDESDGSDDSDD